MKDITLQDRLKFIPMDNLKYPDGLICISLGYGRKPEHLEESHTNTCKLQTESPRKHLPVDSNPVPASCEATGLTTGPPRY